MELTEPSISRRFSISSAVICESEFFDIKAGFQRKAGLAHQRVRRPYFGGGDGFKIVRTRIVQFVVKCDQTDAVKILLCGKDLAAVVGDKNDILLKAPSVMQMHCSTQ